jgi:hypothetical protein
MPEISKFLGIIISMYPEDYDPPHFHVRYEEYRAQLSIPDFTVLTGSLPGRVLELVLEWAAEHRSELIEEWNRAEEGIPLFRIKPLI